MCIEEGMENVTLRSPSPTSLSHHSRNTLSSKIPNDLPCEHSLSYCVAFILIRRCALKTRIEANSATILKYPILLISQRIACCVRLLAL